jgi:uncharacterized protein YecE (DUF72 family)
LTDFLIGAGGWAYFQVPGLRSLETYANAFNFVEVNSTFYEIPNLRLVKSWRQRVPADFEFSVRCHKDVTHRFRLNPLTEALSTFKVMMDICRILQSKYMILVTPPSLGFSREKIESIRDFFESFNLTGVRIVWEVRRRRGEPVPSSLISLMQEYSVIHCVDLSREESAIDSSIVYTRVFGKGEHNIYQFTDEELMEIDEKIISKESDTAVISFHNVKMYKDAARYKIYKQTKEFFPVTKAKGQQSLREVLMEDAEFPASKEELIWDQGWKVIDLTDDRRIHAHRLLEQLPDKRFRDIEEVMMNLLKI